jgi:hypothetical protein
VPHNGTFQLGGPLAFKDITDGLSNTLLAGEKHVPLGGFGVGWLDSSQYNGDLAFSCARSAGPAYPLAATPRDAGWRFGSYHTQVCQFVFCDGAVHPLPVGINPVTLSLLAERADGQTVPDW